MLSPSVLCCFKPAIIGLIVTVHFFCVLAFASLRLQHVRGLPAPVGIPESDGAGLCFCDARLSRTCMSAQHLEKGTIAKSLQVVLPGCAICWTKASRVERSYRPHQYCASDHSAQCSRYTLEAFLEQQASPIAKVPTCSSV